MTDTSKTRAPYYNRRQFMSRSAMGFAAGAAVLGGLGRTSAYAANISGYKAMVCINLKGGMDHGDTILPKDQASYDALKSIREGMFSAYNSDEAESSRNLANILDLAPENEASFGGQKFGLGSDYAPLHEMFNSGDCAVVGSVGPLIEPVDRAMLETGTAELPKKLFSHNDQQSTWMSGSTEGARSGWGGRFAKVTADADQAGNAQFAAITATGFDVFLAGAENQQFRIPTGGSGQPRVANSRWILGYNNGRDEAREKLAAYLARRDFGHERLLRRDVVGARSRGLDLIANYFEQRENLAEMTTEFPNTSLGKQLKTVTEAIALRGTMNVKRQIFYCAMGGFDTHNNQANTMPGKQAEIAGGLVAFRSAMQELGLWDDVVIFTMSDFGRTLIDNGSGTDHGWGAHHFVAGGSVRGNRIYGGMPEYSTNNERYTEQRGRLIPTTSVEQYAATLGRWFGLDEGELAQTLPNLGRFATRDLGFMGSSLV